MLKTIKYPELQVGHIAHFYGARFRITSVELYPQDAAHKAQYGECGETMSARGQWLDGETVRGYFGPNVDWKFQGNMHATIEIETE